MLKKICDCCGNDVNVGIKYKLPSYEETCAYNKGVKLMVFTDLRDTEMDLCDERIVHIANFVKALRGRK